MGLQASSLPPSSQQRTRSETSLPVSRHIARAFHHNIQANYLSINGSLQDQWHVGQSEGAQFWCTQLWEAKATLHAQQLCKQIHWLILTRNTRFHCHHDVLWLKMNEVYKPSFKNGSLNDACVHQQKTRHIQLFHKFQCTCACLTEIWLLLSRAKQQ